MSLVEQTIQQNYVRTSHSSEEAVSCLVINSLYSNYIFKCSVANVISNPVLIIGSV